MGELYGWLDLQWVTGLTDHNWSQAMDALDQQRRRMHLGDGSMRNGTGHHAHHLRSKQRRSDNGGSPDSRCHNARANETRSRSRSGSGSWGSSSQAKESNKDALENNANIYTYIRWMSLESAYVHFFFHRILYLHKEYS